MIKWLYRIETDGNRPQVIEGAMYGLFGEVVTQVRQAVMAEGWASNQAPVVITLTPVDTQG